MEWMIAAALLVVGAVVLVFVARSLAKNSRYARLMAKYGDEKLVHALMTETIWQGMTAEQLRDSWASRWRWNRR